MKGETKKCKSCKTTKPVEEFHKNKNFSDGHSAICKQCKNEYMKKYNAEKKGRSSKVKSAKADKTRKSGKKTAGRNTKKLKSMAVPESGSIGELLHQIFDAEAEVHRLYKEILHGLWLKYIERAAQLRKVKAKLVDQKDL